MKSLQTLAFAIALAFSGLAFAEPGPVEKIKPESIGQAVADLLSSSDVELISDEDVIIEFYVNTKNEIVVKSVETEDYFLSRFIRSQLNYEKISEDLVKTKSHFKILLKFKELR